MRRSVGALGVAAVCSAGAGASDSAARLTQQPPANQQAQQADAGVTVDQVFDRHAEAVGGKDRWSAAQSLKTFGTFSQGATFGLLTSWTNREGEIAIAPEFVGLPAQLQVFDGEHAWVQTSGEVPVLLTGNQRRDLAQSADFYAVIDYAVCYPERRLVGEETFDGAPAHRVDAVSRWGKRETLLFRKRDGLLVGIRSTTTNAAGDAIPLTITISGYRDFGSGTLHPARIRQSTTDTEGALVLRFLDVEINPDDFPVVSRPRLVAEQAQGVEPAKKPSAEELRRIAESG